MNISKILKMTVKEFLLTLINEANTPLESKVESVESKESNAGRPPVGSCLRDDSQREGIAGVIGRMLKMALDTCFNRYVVDTVGMSTGRMLAVVGEVLVDLDIMPEEYSVRDYHKLIKSIPGYENTNYRTLANEINKLSKLMVEKDSTMKTVVRELTLWMKNDSYINELLTNANN